MGFAPHPERSHASYAVTTLSYQQEALAVHISKKYRQPQSIVNRIVSAAYKESSRQGLSPFLILAIIEKESGFRPDVVNFYGAVGLMQVVPRYHHDKLKAPKSQALLALKNPEVNVAVGVRILKEYLAQKEGNLEAALIKYSGNARQYTKKVTRYELALRAVSDSAKAA